MSAGASDTPVRLLLATGLPGGEGLTPCWTRRPARFWSRATNRHAVEVGLAIFLAGTSVIGADVLARAWGLPPIARRILDHGAALVILGAVLGVHALRWLTAPLRLRRARAAVFTEGVVAAVPDLLGLITGGAPLAGVGWGYVGSFRDHEGHVSLYRTGARLLPALRVPTHDEQQRTALLRLLDERGVPRHDG
ncbi:MAG: hypothetical protein M9894_36840 [Planctomycetes bacterium]|nr:hypothetical protein [Planctomycetota bacterium]